MSNCNAQQHKWAKQTRTNSVRHMLRWANKTCYLVNSKAETSPNKSSWSVAISVLMAFLDGCWLSAWLRMWQLRIRSCKMRITIKQSDSGFRLRRKYTAKPLIRSFSPVVIVSFGSFPWWIWMQSSMSLHTSRSSLQASTGCLSLCVCVCVECLRV